MNISQLCSGFVVGAIGGLIFLHSSIGSQEVARPGITSPTAQPAFATVRGPEAKIVDGKVNDHAVFMVEYVAKSANQGGTDQIVKIVSDQKAFIDLLDSRGIVFMAGMFLNDGNRAILFAAKTEDDARRIVNESPLAKSGFYNLRIRQLSVTHAGVITNKLGPRPLEITATPDSSQLETP